MTDKQPKDNKACFDCGNPPILASHEEKEDSCAVAPDDSYMMAPDDSCVVALDLSYDGSGFAGFARQQKQTTVQGELEKALAILLRREVLTVCAGRTDAGVHANNQVVSFTLFSHELKDHSLEKLRASINALVPDGLVAKAITEKPAGFSARFSAKRREYRYRIVSGSIPPVFLARYAWWVPCETPLDTTAMRQAATYLEGEHDFKTFCVVKSSEGKSTIRCIDKIYIFGAQHLGEECVVIHIIGNAFLHSMVRIIVGSLVEVGLRHRPPEWIKEILDTHDRRAAGQTAPPHGLVLWEVQY